MTTLTVRVALVAVGCLILFASAHAAEMSAADLLYRIGDSAAVEAAAQDGAAAQAAQWRQWAIRYWGNAQLMQAFADNGQPVSAAQLLASQIDYSRRAAQQALALGNEPAARFFDASDKLWTDLARQMAAGQKPAVRFPRREMLTAIPGLPGTPWENMEQPQAQQPQAPNAPQRPAATPQNADPMPRPNYGCDRHPDNLGLNERSHADAREHN